eukprot:COSAG06_NODE_1443_length_9453_cov_5.160145_7_plen_109_part_00
MLFVCVQLNEAEGNPIIQCFMSGNFGFAEFRTAQEATNGMNLDKIFIGNTHLNVGRPSKCESASFFAAYLSRGPVAIRSLTLRYLGVAVEIVWWAFCGTQIWARQPRT